MTRSKYLQSKVLRCSEQPGLMTFFFHLWESVLDKDKTILSTLLVPQFQEGSKSPVCSSLVISGWLMNVIVSGVGSASLICMSCLSLPQTPSQACSDTISGSYLGAPYPAKLIPKINQHAFHIDGTVLDRQLILSRVQLWSLFCYHLFNSLQVLFTGTWVGL